MGYRDRERRDPYLWRLSEKIRKSEVEGLIAAGRAAELSGEIEHRKRSEEAKRFLEQMHEEKASVLKQILGCSSIHKDKWYEHLNSIDLTRPGVDTELKNLLEEVERERRLWSDEPFELPDKLSEFPESLKRFSEAEMKSLLGAQYWLSTKPKFTRGQSSSSLNPVELRLRKKEEELELIAKQYYENQAIKRKLKESALAGIVSSLRLLISTRNLYESTRS